MCQSDALGDREGRASRPFPTGTPPPPSPHPPDCVSSKSALANLRCGIQSRVVSASARGVQPPAKHRTRGSPASTSHLPGQGALLGHDAQTAVRLLGPEPRPTPTASSSLPFSPKAAGTPSSTKQKLTRAVLHSICTGVN